MYIRFRSSYLYLRVLLNIYYTFLEILFLKNVPKKIGY